MRGWRERFGRPLRRCTFVLLRIVGIRDLPRSFPTWPDRFAAALTINCVSDLTTHDLVPGGGILHGSVTLRSFRRTQLLAGVVTYSLRAPASVGARRRRSQTTGG